MDSPPILKGCRRIALRVPGRITVLSPVLISVLIPVLIPVLIAVLIATSAASDAEQPVLGSVGLGSAGLGSARLGSAGFGSAGLGSAALGSVELVETVPVGTALDHADLPETHEVWLDMVASARETLCFAEFYASNRPGSRLEVIVEAVEEAAGRGVDVRFLAEENFYSTYPQTLDRLAAHPGISVRRLPTRSIMGGVLHAKYFLVDSREVFVGSQNFDWRALEHIQELGLRIRNPQIASALARVFEMDWALAGGAGADETAADPFGGSEHAGAADPSSGPKLADASIEVAEAGMANVHYDGQSTELTLVASPQDWLPPGILWDLPEIVALIDGAESSIRIQLLSYRTVGRDGAYYAALESALRRAAGRGVKVEMLLADWSKRPGRIEGLQSLQALPGIEIRLATIPPAPEGFIPYARVIHAKYMVADAQRAWLGTSNWERDYFHASRNVGFLIEGTALAGRMDAYFRRGWESPYVEPVDPCRAYRAPRIGE